jgi:hypothetical protein
MNEGSRISTILKWLADNPAFTMDLLELVQRFFRGPAVTHVVDCTSEMWHLRVTHSLMPHPPDAPPQQVGSAWHVTEIRPAEQPAAAAAPPRITHEPEQRSIELDGST